MTADCVFGLDAQCTRCGRRQAAQGVRRNCTAHPDYVKRELKPIAGDPLPVAVGPGSHLSRLLAKFGIQYTPGCKCRSMAAKMDALGCEWCESDQGMGEILEAMRTEAAKRSLPFLDAVGRLLVRRAVKAARKEAARGTEATGCEGDGSAV